MGRPNFLLITVDDMNYNSAEFLRDPAMRMELMPNLCRLMDEGMTCTNSHVTIGLCQPSRSVLMTGRYPHCNGARGFEDIGRDVVTLTQLLHEHGYLNGIIGKENHISPREQFAWDMYERTYEDETGYGRDPDYYYQKAQEFLAMAKREKKPFFLMFNSHDPHRPFAGSEDELKMFGRHIPCSRTFEPGEVRVPGFLPDLPEIREEFAQYLGSVHRADEAIGRALQALAEAGHEEDTMIFFLSDNGMSMPFAKANCYLNSTKSPYVMKWKGHIPEGVTTEALLATIDYMPSILEIAGIPCPREVDGRSFTHLFGEPSGEQYQDIYTSFYKTAKNQVTKRELQFPMRCVQDKQYAYIYNGWYGKGTLYRTETMAGKTFSAMQEAAKTDAHVAARVEFYQNRVKEELYDYRKDPDALCNLAGQPEYAAMLLEKRNKMHEYMKTSKDELLQMFEEEMEEKK